MTLISTRRTMLKAGAAGLAGALIGGPTFAARRTGPGGFSQEGLHAVTAQMQSLVDRGAAAGLVSLLYRHGEVAQVNALGLQDIAANRAMKRNTIFRLASMTKPITCVAALTLMEQGKFTLSDPVSKWLPELGAPKVLDKVGGSLSAAHPAARPITVLDLLTHRSGFAYYFTTSGPLAKALQAFHGSDQAPDEWLKRLAALPLAHEPGSVWNYGLSHDVLGVMIERVSGMPFARYVQSVIFDPLQMKDSGFSVPADKQDRVAVLYGLDPASGKRVPGPPPVPQELPKFCSGGGGLHATADDYLQFARMMLGRGRLGDVRILSHATTALITTNWLTPEQRKIPFLGLDFWSGQGFGLGLSVVDDPPRLGGFPYGSKGAFGWPGAYGTWWQADPAEDMIAIYLVQNAPNLVPSATTQNTNFNAGPVTLSALAYQAIDD